MNSQTETFQRSELNGISLQLTKLRNLIGGHLISIESDYGQIIDNIFDDQTTDNDYNERTSDDIINDIIKNISENDINITESNDKNSFSVSTADIDISNDITNFLNTETETNESETKSFRGGKRLK